MENLSREAVEMLVQALDRYRHGVVKDIEGSALTEQQKGDLAEYLVRIDLVFDELKEHYDACRAENPDMMPMTELIRGNID